MIWLIEKKHVRLLKGNDPLHESFMSLALSTILYLQGCNLNGNLDWCQFSKILRQNFTSENLVIETVSSVKMVVYMLPMYSNNQHAAGIQNMNRCWRWRHFQNFECRFYTQNIWNEYCLFFSGSSQCDRAGN